MTRELVLTPTASSILTLQSTPSVNPSHLLQDIPSPSIRKYVTAVAALVDKHAVCICGSPGEAEEFLSLLTEPNFRRSAIQDIRSGRLFDRSPTSPVDPLLRLRVEFFLFKNRPDPQRSLEISKTENLKSLLPRLSVIIDETGEEEISSIRGIPVFRPIKKSPQGEIIAVWSENGYISLAS